MNRKEKMLSFAAGFAAYPLLELLWRGRTHWSMALAGGLATALLYPMRKRKHFCLRAALVITLIELLFGIFFNLLLGKKVWDYSDRPLNLWGQICLPYCLLWFLLGVPLRFLFRGLEKICD